MEHEDKAGIGYVDFIFYPINRNEDCVILELKVDYAAKKAIPQIKGRKYALKLRTDLAKQNAIPAGSLLSVLAMTKKQKSTAVRLKF